MAPPLPRRPGQRRSLGPRWRRDADRPAAPRRCRDDGRRLGRLPQRDAAAARGGRGRGEADPEAVQARHRSMPGRTRSSVCWAATRRPTSSISRSTVDTTRTAPATGSTSSRARRSTRSRSAAPTSPVGRRSCSSTPARSAPPRTLLGSYGGIAQAFLQVGASAVVAPLWSIDDAIAQQIALEFYEQALAADRRRPPRRTDGGADDRRATNRPPSRRRPAPQGTGRPRPERGRQSSTYLAYQFYGHPSLRLSWHGADATQEDRDG